MLKPLLIYLSNHLFETYSAGVLYLIINHDNLAVGITRLFYPFFCGLLFSCLFQSTALNVSYASSFFV